MATLTQLSQIIPARAGLLSALALASLLSAGCQTGHRTTLPRMPYSGSVGNAGVHRDLPGNPPSTANPLTPSPRGDLITSPPPVPEIMAPVGPVLSQDEAVGLFRSVGGKLRPDDDGTIVEIDLSFSSITDGQLREIATFTDLAELDLTGTDIRDGSLDAIAELRGLQALKLKGTSISDDGMLLISDVQSLILLDASNTAITDAGLRKASRWENLRYLSLNNTAITDEGLRHLESLGNLRGLSIVNTSVTEDGVRRLKKRLPDCLIVASSTEETRRLRNRSEFRRVAARGDFDAGSDGVTSPRQLAQVVALAKQQPNLAVYLSELYSSHERWSDAAEILAAGVAADPSDTAIHFALGNALARTGRPDEALEHFELAVDPATARYHLAMIVYENSLKRSARLFDQVLVADPSLDAAQNRRDQIRNELQYLGRNWHSPVEETHKSGSPEIQPAPHRQKFAGPKRSGAPATPASF